MLIILKIIAICREAGLNFSLFHTNQGRSYKYNQNSLKTVYYICVEKDSSAKLFVDLEKKEVIKFK